MEGIALVVILVLALAVEPFVVMLLWNWLMTRLFGLPEIGFCEAFCLMVLFSLLAGGVKVGSKE